jgi:enoyl-CoA hydratase
MTFQNLIYEKRGAAAWVTLNRPEVMNSLDPATIADLDGAMDAAQADPGVRALVVTGTGRAFCAGADLKFLGGKVGPEGIEALAGFLQQILPVFNRLEALPMPVIAAVNGLALAGGLEIVLCCDLVIAAESAKIGDAHANFGLLPGGGGSVRLPRKIGPTRAKYLLYTGDFVPAADLVAAGLVNQVVPDDKLVQAVEAVIQRIVVKSPLGLRRMKQLVDDGLNQPNETALRFEILAGEAHAKSHDMSEGLAAFNGKRKPKFTGK